MRGETVANAFQRCDFLLGQGYSVLIVVPAHLPDADTYTVSVSDRDIRFRAGQKDIAEVPYDDAEVFERIANNIQVGLVEYAGQDFPTHITHVAYVEVRRSV